MPPLASAGISKVVFNKFFINHKNIELKLLNDFNSGSWLKFKKYLQSMPDNFHPLNGKLIFENTPVNKEDYASQKLSYALTEGSCDCMSHRNL